MLYFKYLEIFFLLTSTFSLVTADLVTGNCPKAIGNKFNYKKLFLEHEYDSELNMVIYGFLPSSPNTKSLNPFALNFGENIHISEYHIRLYKMENEETSFILGCTFYKYGTINILHLEIEFTINEIVDDNIKFLIVPRLATINNETCSKYLQKEFEYVSYTSAGRYLAIWGCHQINASTYDRGLWVLGVNKNINNTFVENAREKITDALADMKLENQTGIWENLIVNQNIFTPDDKKNCIADLYYNECNRVKYEKPQNLIKLKNAALFGFFCALLIFGIIFACILILKQKN